MDERDKKRQQSLMRKIGIGLSLLAAASIGVSIADVTVTYFVLCDSGNHGDCVPTIDTANPRSFASLMCYIAAGVWASLAVFLVSVWTITRTGNNKKCDADDYEFKQSRNRYLFLSFITGFLLVPVMIVTNVVQTYMIWRITDLGSDDETIKTALPIAVSALGALEFVVMGYLLIKMCTWMYEPEVCEDEGKRRPMDEEDPYYGWRPPRRPLYPPPPPPLPRPAPAYSYGPYVRPPMLEPRYKLPLVPAFRAPPVARPLPALPAPSFTPAPLGPGARYFPGYLGPSPTPGFF